MGEAKELICSRCGRAFLPNELRNLCPCGGPLLVRYDIEKIKRTYRRDQLGSFFQMWRYEPVLPASREDAVTLGEGGTPLLRTPSLGQNVWVKDEGTNPTGSFKARGMSVAVTMARKLGAKKLAAPSAGNAGGALAAYAACAGLEAHVFMPSDVPQANFVECMAHGATVTLVNGLIDDCGRIVSEQKEKNGWFEVSTLKEPYRIEGKKTMGYEVAEQFGWELPDAILYPCGGGVGLIGMWKAFDEMEQLGWTGSKRPKMIAVQAAGCAPIVRAMETGAETSEMWKDAHTLVSGLRVPKALGDFLILRTIRESKGTAIAVSDEEAMDGALQLAKSEGILPAPETGTCVAALARLFRAGFLERHERVVVFNTGSGLKYLDAFLTRFSRRIASEQDKLGGLITPR